MHSLHVGTNIPAAAVPFKQSLGFATDSLQPLQPRRLLKQQEHSKVLGEAETGGDSPKGRAFPNLLHIQQSMLVPVSKP